MFTDTQLKALQVLVRKTDIIWYGGLFPDGVDLKARGINLNTLSNILEEATGCSSGEEALSSLEPELFGHKVTVGVANITIGEYVFNHKEFRIYTDLALYHIEAKRTFDLWWRNLQFLYMPFPGRIRALGGSMTARSFVETIEGLTKP